MVAECSALQILCVAGILRMQLQVTSTIVNALGKVSAEIWRRATAFALLTLGCWLGSFWGITGVAIAVAISTAILAVTMVSYLQPTDWSDLVRCPATARPSVHRISRDGRHRVHLSAVG